MPKLLWATALLCCACDSLGPNAQEFLISCPRVDLGGGYAAAYAATRNHDESGEAEIRLMAIGDIVNDFAPGERRQIEGKTSASCALTAAERACAVKATVVQSGRSDSVVLTATLLDDMPVFSLRDQSWHEAPAKLYAAPDECVTDAH